MNQTQKYFLLILICFSLHVQSKTLNPVVIENQAQQFGKSRPVVLNDQLVYELVVNGGSELWKYNPITQKNERFYRVPVPENPSSFQNLGLVAFQEAVYFSQQSQNSQNFELWKTDLTAGGTAMVSDQVPSFSQSKIVNGVLIFSSNNILFRRYYGIEGDQVVEYPLLSSSSISTFQGCVFDIGNVVLADASRIQQFVNGTIIDHTLNFPEQFVVRRDTIWQDQNNCYLTAFNNNEAFIEVIKITKDGQISFITETHGLESLNYTARVGDSVLGIEAGFPNLVIHKLSPSLDAIEGSFTFDSLFALSDFRVTKNFLVVKTTTPTISPAIQAVTYFNKNLDIIEGIGGDARFEPLPQSYPTSNSEIILMDKNFPLPGYNFSFVEDDADTAKKIRATQIEVESIISNNRSDQAYTIGVDRGTNKRKIYAVDAQPNIGDQVNGIWIDPTLQGQGLSITKSVRADGTEYLFLTLNTFRDGELFWLAGSADILPSQRSVDVALLEFNGLDLFQKDAAPNQSQFGTINLQFSSCNTLIATVRSAEGVFTLNLARIDDATFAEFCAK